MPIDRTDATADQIKALASPIRLRILRRCHLAPQTNQQLAEWLGCDPSTSLYHLRRLAGAGFLEPAPPGPSAGSSREKPYRATALSWMLDVGLDPDVNLAMLDAFRTEVVAAGAGAVDASSRFALHLDDDELRTFVGRVQDLLDEYVDADAERREAGRPRRGGFFMVHGLADG